MPRLIWLGVLLCACVLNSSSTLAQTVFTQIGEFDIPAANQGIGVDGEHFYAINNHTIAKYTKSGEHVATWEGGDEGPVLHLDSAAVIDGKIYCSHSNYRTFPMTSSIEVWDADTLEHIGTHSFGILLGSLTWLDRYDGHFWGTFANYDRTGRLPDGSNTDEPYGTKYNTTLVRFDRNWQVAEAWVFPQELLERFEQMSNSGGSFGPDGRLYITGHDPAEVYKIRFPEAGSILEVEEVIPANIRGQGVAWDPVERSHFYGIIRATDEEEAAGQTNRVVVFDTNVKPLTAQEKHARRRFRP